MCVVVNAGNTVFSHMTLSVDSFMAAEEVLSSWGWGGPADETSFSLTAADRPATSACGAGAS